MRTIKNNKINVMNSAKIYVKTSDFSTIKSIKLFKNEIKISYKLTNGNFKELVIKENGVCDLYNLEAFIAHFLKHYSVGICSEGTLKCVAESIYHLAITHHNNKNITAIILENIRSFELPTHSYLNRDEDFQLPSAQYHAVIASKLAAFIHH